MKKRMLLRLIALALICVALLSACDEWEVAPISQEQKQSYITTTDATDTSAAKETEDEQAEEREMGSPAEGNQTETAAEAPTIAPVTQEAPEGSYFDVAYDTDSFVEAGDTIRLNATAHLGGRTDICLDWQSADNEVATVDDGLVTGIGAGFTFIRVCAAECPALYFDFGVTVYDEADIDIVKSAITANNSNIKTVDNLGVGSGTPAYYVDLTESVSKLLFNEPYTLNTDYEAIQAGVTTNHGGALGAVEFITVHYTGNMNAAAGAAFHANYFAKGSGGTSIHYTVGNDGVYHILSDDLVAYHAGDGTGAANAAAWYATGVMCTDEDDARPVWGISANSKYTINGKETAISVPAGNTADTKRVTSDKWINDMGFAYKVIDGEYYMSKTWWCYKQVAEGRLCNKGGNTNSIGIETCVNKGSDLWYTWHLTARLAAHLLQTYDLPVERVVGHHFFTAKDCPQPLLADDMSLWWDFIECVKAESALLAQSQYKITMTPLTEGIAENGRVTARNKHDSLLTYRLDIADGNGTVRSLTLAAILCGTDDLSEECL